MTNTKTSPLYFYLKSQIDFQKPKGVTIRAIQKIKEMIDLVLTDCCIPTRPSLAFGIFVQTAYVLLKEMDTRNDIYKLQAIQTYLDKVITCCQ